MKKISYFWRHGLWALISLGFLGLIAFAVLYIYVESQLPDIESLKTVKLEVPMQIYTQDGLLIQEYGEIKRIPIAYDKIPQKLIQALLVTEDQRFFEHPGVDIFGLARATVRMIKTHSKSQGGSTITMQVARNFFLDRKKTFLRKFNEIVLAVKIDHELSKEKILELYMNKIYLGNRAYGVEAAAHVYYGKPLNELNLAELAMIAGLPQAPSSQNPINNPKGAKARRNHVLDRMLEEHFITMAEYRKAIEEPIRAHVHTTDLQVQAPFVAEMIRQSLYDQFGSDAYTRGYRVYATIHSDLQQKANQTVQEHLIAYDRRHGYRGPVTHIHDNVQQLTTAALQKMLAPWADVNDMVPALVIEVNERQVHALTRHDRLVNIDWSGLSWARPALKKGWVGRAPTRATQIVSVGDIVYVQQNSTWQLAQIPQLEAALVALNPNTGAIEALVGGFNFPRSKFNRATQSSRQPGSNFKPFIYAAALNKGYSLATLINDAPITVDDPSQANLWRPHNVDYKFGGPTRLKDALTHSRNLVSIRILDDIGFDYTIDFVSRFGFQKNNMPHSLSLALGSLEVSPLEIATAYAVFANNGYKVEPYLIDHITDSDGHVVLQAKPNMAPVPETSEPIEPDELAPRVIPEDLAFLMHSALQGVIQDGTAQDAKRLNRHDIAGKTGTTNDQMDAWFSGYTPDLVATVWVGFDNPAPLHEYAARLALPLWVDFMKAALQNKPEHLLTPPKNVVSVQINPKTGLREKNEKNSITEYFREQEIPEEDETPEFSAHDRHQHDDLF